MPCQCDGEGYCPIIGRWMPDHFWKVCKRSEVGFEMFLREAAEGKYDDPSFKKPPVIEYINPATGEIIDEDELQIGSVPLRTPSLFRKAKNAFNSAKEAIQNWEKAEPSEYVSRGEICRNCEYRKEDSCGACGCNLRLKQSLKAWHCPFAKWDGDVEYYSSKVSSIRNWGVGVVTSPRRKPTLEDSKRSIAEAGWKDPLVYTDSNRTGPWNAFRFALASVIASNPEADAYLMFQDDVQVSRNAREYLESVLWPGDDPTKVGAVSIYCPGTRHRDNERFYQVAKDKKTWGALALVFTPLSARIFIATSKQYRKGTVQSDVKIGNYLHQAGFDYWLHSPSLVQHTGEVSTLTKLGLNRGRRAKVFCEDAKTLTSEK